MTRYDDLSSELERRFPALRAAYARELAWWKDEKPGQHVIFGDLFNPHVIELLTRGTDATALQEVFDFIETLASDPDKRTRDLANVTICEAIVDALGVAETAKRYAGPRTRAILEAIERRWGVADPGG